MYAVIINLAPKLVIPAAAERRAGIQKRPLTVIFIGMDNLGAVYDDTAVFHRLIAAAINNPCIFEYSYRTHEKNTLCWILNGLRWR